MQNSFSELRTFKKADLPKYKEYIEQKYGSVMLLLRNAAIISAKRKAHLTIDFHFDTMTGLVTVTNSERVFESKFIEREKLLSDQPTFF